ncbi:hypothetical protein H0O03_02410, partial [Candidatus Micrarchaeota archaeon]|nr:hypothetical protein [Candidatus Micrarchaeota archaeon]
EVKMFECYDELVKRLPKDEFKKQAAAIRAQEANHLKISSEIVGGIVANPFLAKEPVFFERGRELEELVGPGYADLIKPRPKSVDELLDYCYHAETFYETAYAKLIPRIRIPQISQGLMQMVNESKAHARIVGLMRKNL